MALLITLLRYRIYIVHFRLSVFTSYYISNLALRIKLGKEIE